MGCDTASLGDSYKHFEGMQHLNLQESWTL